MSEANRFFIAERYADNGELSHRALVDAADGRELGTDGGEPEDQSFWRDWAWVPDEMNKLGNEIVTLRDERDRLKREKDGAYLERNQVVAALAKLFPSGIARTAIEGWSEDWHGCVYIDLPTGQVSWHYHDSHAHLFDGIPPYRGTWDGHSTEEKYQRVAALTPAAPPLTPNEATE